MRALKRIIPTILLAVPLMGSVVSGNASNASHASTDSVSVGTVIDEVIWVVGDEAILKSDVEVMRMQAAMEGVKWSGNPDCTIPEQIAVQKLFKHKGHHR